MDERVGHEVVQCPTQRVLVAAHDHAVGRVCGHVALVGGRVAGQGVQRHGAGAAPA